MIKIYTDGSCLGNPGNGGWAAIIFIGKKKISLKGSKKNTTNNQMELLAPIKALKKIPIDEKIEIFTDSKYLKLGIMEMDHLNRDTSDSRIENLSMKCPNCHSQTLGYKNRTIPIEEYFYKLKTKTNKRLW